MEVPLPDGQTMYGGYVTTSRSHANYIRYRLNTENHRFPTLNGFELSGRLGSRVFFHYAKTKSNKLELNSTKNSKL